MHKVNWLEKAVFYNIYPQSYYDSNGDGIGNLAGICEKLDYIHEIGFNALWLNPFYESTFRDGGYDITNFYKVAPRYGTNEDFVRLCEKAHSLGIKVCVDMVAGHTSMNHPWFQESAKAMKNEYTNRYIWSDTWLKAPEASFVNGYSERNGCYMANFFYNQPALNYGFAKVDDPSWQLPMDHPDCRATKQELLNIMEFWMQLGCDGFRVDLASSLVKNDPDGSGIRAFWNEIRTLFDEKYPECVLISEWGDPFVSIPAGFHIDFLTHCFYQAYTKLLRADKNRNVGDEFQGNTYFDREGKGDFAEFLDEYQKMLDATKGKGYVSIPTGNHDLPRYSVARSQEELKLIMAFILTMPGVPFVYYGDEIGMCYQANLISKEGGYNRTGSRTPMQWKKGRNLGFSEGEEKDLYLPVDAYEDAPTVEEQLEDETSLLRLTQKLIALRMTSAALSADGEVTFLNHKERGYPLVYLRTDGQEKYLVCINPTDKPLTFHLCETEQLRDVKGYTTVLESKAVAVEDGILRVSAVGFSILKVAE